MSIELYPSIAKIKRNGVYENLPGFVPETGSIATQQMIATSESSATAQYVHNKGEYFRLNDTLYQAIVKINVGDAIVVGTNCEVAVLGNDVTHIANSIAEYELGIATSTHATGEYFMVGETLYVATADIDIGDSISTSTNCRLAVVGDELSALHTAIGEIDSKFYTTIGKNKVDMSTAVVGALQSNGTIATNGTWASYHTSDFIELEANTDYFVTVFNSAYPFTNARKIYGLYNANKEIVTSTYVNESGADYVTFNSGANYKYIRVACLADRTCMLEKGEYSNVYAPYITHEYLSTNIGENAITQIENTFGESAKIFLKDMHDTEQDTNGYIYYNGLLSTSGSFKTSDFIRVFSGNKYSIEAVRAICVFDDDKLPIDYYSYNTSQERIFEAENTAYIRFSYNADAQSSSMKEVYEGTLTHKLEEKVDLSDRQKEVVGVIAAEKAGNYLYGKKWVVLGDSFTNGATNTTIQTGKYAGSRAVYPYLIGNRNEMNIVKFFEGGRTLAFPETPGDFTNSVTCPTADCYYQNIPADADYITIMLGINDGHHAPSSEGGDGEDNTGEIPIGTLDDATTATFGGAWNVVLTWLLTNRPNAHIGILVSNGLDSIDYRTMTINAAKKYGLPYLDLNGDERCRAMIRCQNTDIPASVKSLITQAQAVDPSTNTHPNDAAHKLESTFIENFLRSI